MGPTNETDVVCSVCRRSFETYDQVETHVREEHGGQGGRGPGGSAGDASNPGSRGTDTAPDG